MQLTKLKDLLTEKRDAERALKALGETQSLGLDEATTIRLDVAYQMARIRAARAGIAYDDALALAVQEGLC